MTISILSVLLLVNFMLPTYSQADFGGVLLNPITDLVAGLGDIVIGLVQGFMNLSVGEKFSVQDITVKASEFETVTSNDSKADENDSKADENDSNADENKSKYNKFAIKGTETVQETINKSDLNKKYEIPLASLSPEEIFGGKVAALDINFINPDKSWGETEDGIVKSSAGQLQSTIASWYVALRNLAVVGLLSILVYVGIKIILSSTASDKAKYKQMLVDWIVALCLLFFMQYIMSFIITMTESITTAIVGDKGGLNIAVTVQDGTNVDKAFATNLMGLSRLKLQSKETIVKCSYLIIYIFLIYYTIVFTWKYLKRMIMMAFLTIISPLVVLTYPIDKMNDGKAQAFDAWLKEYIFNALLQPFHLVIYYVFVLSAMDLAANNLLYTIVVMWFIPKAEEILRKFFGFDKAPSLGNTMAGFAGGLGLSKLMSGKGGSKGKSSKGTSGETKPPRFNRSTDINELPEGNGSPERNNELPEGNTEENTEEGNSQNALDKYSAEGFEQNDNGEYYNPWTDEYDANYDPRKDPNYASQQPRETQDNAQQNSTQQTATQAATQPTPQDEAQETAQTEKTRIRDKVANSKLGNLARAHGGKEMIPRAIRGAARFATRTTFTLAGGMGGAILGAAQGKGVSGMLLGAYAGARTGNSASEPVIGLGGTAWNATARVAKGIRARSLDPVLGGTALGREIDLANGNTRYQDAGTSSDVKTNKDNVQYVREYLTDKNGGRVPTNKEIKAQMNSLDPYIEKGFSDIKDMIKSQKAAQKMGLDDTQAAIIAAIGKKNNITPDRLNDSKKAQADYENLIHQLQNAGVSKENAEKRADLAMNYLKEKEGIKNKK